MPDRWFHKRLPDEGTGYSVASRQGIFAGIAVIVAVTLGIVVPVTLGAGPWAVYGIATAALLVSLVFLRLLIRQKSDG